MHCRRSMLASIHEDHHYLIEARAYGPKALLRPNTNFLKTFTKAEHVARIFTNKNATILNFKKNLMKTLALHIENVFHCQKHDLFNLLLDKFCIFYIFMYTKNINLILKGIESRSGRIDDVLKKLALVKYNKTANKKSALKNMKKLIV